MTGQGILFVIHPALLAAQHRRASIFPFDAVILGGILIAFVAGSLAVASIEWDRRRSQRTFRSQVKAARLDAPTLPLPRS